MQKLKNYLQDFVSSDLAAFYLGVILGLFDENEYQENKYVFFTNNELGNALYDFLLKLIDLNILETTIDKTQIKWKMN